MSNCIYCSPSTAGAHEVHCPLAEGERTPADTPVFPVLRRPLLTPAYGWSCPRCKKVHAPWIQECDCNSGAEPLLGELRLRT